MKLITLSNISSSTDEHGHSTGRDVVLGAGVEIDIPDAVWFDENARITLAINGEVIRASKSCFKAV